MFSTYSQYQSNLLYFESQEGKMAYFDEGQGECILLLHGVPTSSWLYRKIIPILLQKGYRVIAPDMLGYGSSDKPEGYELYSDFKMGERILRMMAHLEVGSWSHVFHDGGGLWTWAMLEQDQTKVKNLFMLNTIIYQTGFKPPIKFEKGIIAKLFTRLYSYSKFTQKISIDPTFKNGIHHKNKISSDMLEGYKVPLKGKGHLALYYFFTQTCKQIKDYSPLHQSLKIPLTVIWGKWDDVLRWEGNEEHVKLNFTVSQDDIHLIDAKHFIQEEQPEEIAEIIIQKLQKTILT
ncbi:MAG: alpha/beta fold hydrolase [Saprospiraceae bacterium]|nr:alpha/beta fold hydrolase [Saprospiraceae bacterium]